MGLRDRVLDTGIGLVHMVFDKRLFQLQKTPPNKMSHEQHRIMRLSNKRERQTRAGAKEAHEGSQMACGQAKSIAQASTQQHEIEKHNQVSSMFQHDDVETLYGCKVLTVASTVQKYLFTIGAGTQLCLFI